MKINRRDYLKRLSAAGMLAGVTGLEGFAHEHADPQRSCPGNPPCRGRRAPLVWEPRWCDPLPLNNNYVKLIFEGLTGIAPVRLGGKVGCEVGFHSDGDSPIHHELQITAYSNVVNPSNCPPAIRFPQKIESVTLRVTDPVPEVAQTYFYQRGPACTRRDLTDDADFRWIVDFESDYLYRKHIPSSELEKNENVYSPVLLVEYGIFYTLQKSASTFVARSEDNEHFIDLANVARMIAANVYVRSGPVMLTVNNRPPVPIQPPAEIYFRNHCKKGNGHCDFNPNHPDKKKRSDFFLNYKAFERKDAPEYYLHLLESKDPQIPNVICERDRFTPTTEDKRRELLLNDESPCSAAGYGGGNRGLPPY